MAATGKMSAPKLAPRGGFHLPRRNLSIAALVFVLITALLAGFIWYIVSGSPAEHGMTALIKAYSKRRLIEPRLSGGFHGGEFNPQRDDFTKIDTREHKRAVDLISKAVSDSEDLFAEQVYARLLLIESSSADAQKRFRRVLEQKPESAEARNDYGACLLERGKLEEAIEQFDEALMINAEMPEALFNRALCYQRLLLRDAAREDYDRLAQIERDQSWKSEIRARRDEVSSPLTPGKRAADIVAAFDEAIAGNNLEEAKRIIDNNLEVITKHAYLDIPINYLKDSLAGSPEDAERSLTEIELISKQFIQAKDDTSVADLALYLRNLRESDQAVELGLINNYREAEKLFFAKKYYDAQAAFDRLGQLFGMRNNHVFQNLSTFYVGMCKYVSGNLSSSLETMKEALNVVEKYKWPNRRAQISCQLGITYSRLGQDSLAIKSCEKALQTSKGMFYLEAKALQFMSEAYSNMGDLDNKLNCLRKSTNLYLSNVPTLVELANNYLGMAESYSLRGNHSLALLCAQEALRFSNEAKDNNRAAQTSSFMAVEHARLNRFVEAEEEINHAFTYLEKVKDGRSFTEQFVLASAADVALRRGDTSSAIERYSKAVKVADQIEDKAIPQIKVLRGRAEAYIEAREFDKARLDLERAIELIDDYRANIYESKNRSSFLDASHSVFDQLILLNIEALGRRSDAFDVAEQSRARTLLDEISLQQRDSLRASHTPISPLKLAEVQAALPDGLRLLVYSVTDRRTYLFLITHSGFEMAVLPATTETLDHLARDYVSGLKTQAHLEELKEKGRELYRHLIEPVEAQLSDGKSLCIVPDKALHFLPFAALVDGTGQYLVQSYRLTYAPSASALAHCIKEARTKAASKAEKILAIGNPEFNYNEFRGLQELPDAQDEAIESAKLYEERVTLIRDQATKAKVREALKDCDVAHLALHCLVDEKSPWLAALLLADPKHSAEATRQAKTSAAQRGSETEIGDTTDLRLENSRGFSTHVGESDGLLHLNEIYSMSLPRTRLVVLSACQSGLGQYYRGEGIVSLARPFLALRVPTVVVSLWAVESRATATLMIDFHRARKADKLGAGEALRIAQIKMSQRHPYYWAPFIAVGSNK